MRLAAILAVATLSLATTASHAAIPEEAYDLRNRAQAALENENDKQAEELYRELLKVYPRDPLGHANLAIALRRQDRFDEAREAIDDALERAPGRADLLFILSEIQEWSGEREAALTTLLEAAASDDDNLEVLYSLWQQASTMSGERAEREATAALERLADMRPENLWVLVKLGQQAIARGDRATATRAYLRLRELTWQADEHEKIDGFVAEVLDALEDGDLARARRPAIYVGNLLQGPEVYTNSLGELHTEVRGLPVLRFVDEPAASIFGKPLQVYFRGESLRQDPVADVIAADLGELVETSGDTTSPPGSRFFSGGAPEVIFIAGGEIHIQGSEQNRSLPAAGHDRLAVFDLDNDGRLDLLAYGPEADARLWRNNGDSFVDATADFGLGGRRLTAAAAIDFDSEGDLDLALGSAEGLELMRNQLDGPLTAVGEKVFPPLELGAVAQLVATDVDRDGDPDLLVVAGGTLRWLDNLRQGQLADRDSGFAGPAGLTEVSAVATADLDNDGRYDLAVAGRGLHLFRGTDNGLEAWEVSGDVPSTTMLTAVELADLDNDGRLDVVLGGESGFLALGQRAAGGFLRLSVLGDEGAARSTVTADLDGDGDLDVLAASGSGLRRFDNYGGDANASLRVRLRGLDTGNDKNNVFGLGATIEVRRGNAYQLHEVQRPVTHIGLGDASCADLLRITWSNGVPQNRLQVCDDQAIVEEQVLKGSCPFLYTWTGEAVHFVTDLLWSAPLGMPVGEGLWAGADPEELVRVDGAVPRHGRYDLRITEELWEAAFFDYSRLWVVDHPQEIEVASNLRVVPGEVLDDRVLATADVRPMSAAIDGRGRDVTERVRRRDEVYADGFERSRYQGVSERPWSFTFDLGAAPGGPVRLLLDGWIFPADASLNLAVAQRREPPALTRLEVETAAGWRVLIPKMGHPAGKTKTMVVDTPPLPAGAHRLRIVTSKWLSWDRVAWSTAPRDDATRVVARLAPESAQLRERGFSRMLRLAPNAPHVYDYARVDGDSPWLPLPGGYTRLGDVRELLLEPDDRSVVMAAGDEMRLVFDASQLPPPAPGYRRTVFLESHGWDKDADRNTWRADRVEPLPFRAMSGYPYGEGETYPRTPRHDDYLERWQTRIVAPQPLRAASPGS